MAVLPYCETMGMTASRRRRRLANSTLHRIAEVFLNQAVRSTGQWLTLRPVNSGKQVDTIQEKYCLEAISMREELGEVCSGHQFLQVLALSLLGCFLYLNICVQYQGNLKHGPGHRIFILHLVVWAQRRPRACILLESSTRY